MQSNIIKSKLPAGVTLGDFITIQKNVTVGEGTRICNYVNLYGCRIGKDCMIGPFVEIQDDALIGDGTRISSHSFVCSRVTIGRNCFIAHSVVFTNDDFGGDRVNFARGNWKSTVVEDGVIIGSNATILPVCIGSGSVIGAGAVVTRDVPRNSVVFGNPARVKRDARG